MVTANSLMFSHIARKLTIAQKSDGLQPVGLRSEGGHQEAIVRRYESGDACVIGTFTGRPLGDAVGQMIDGILEAHHRTEDGRLRWVLTAAVSEWVQIPQEARTFLGIGVDTTRGVMPKSRIPGSARRMLAARVKAGRV